MKAYGAAALVALAMTLCTPAAVRAWDNSSLVTTRNGTVAAFEDDCFTWVWQAIPYARPPVGELRWKAPLAPDPWDGILQADAFCEKCPQAPWSDSAGDMEGSEDCLYLNIWRPRTEETDLPVYVWIHGGSNRSGSAGEYNAAALADAANMLVVTINYRLGVLGWLTHPALRDGIDELSSSGNYGTLDIIRALAWVRENIAAFGGDPDTVTAAGQSAGGVNVFTLMISPAAAGLFQRAIAQSGSLEPVSPEQGDRYAEKLIEALLLRDGTVESESSRVRRSMSNAEIAGYLRTKTAAEILAAAADVPTSPAVFTDGAVIPLAGAGALDDPAGYNQVPIIIGSTSEEGKLFLYLFGLHTRWNPLFYQFFAKQGSRSGRVRGLDSLAYAMRSHDSQPGVYGYIFQYGQYRRAGYNAWPADSGPTQTMSWAVALGACHALDIPFNFGTFSFPLFEGFDQLIFRNDNRPGREALSEAMIAYTARFARTGNPNTPGLPAWSEWPAKKYPRIPRYILFDADDTTAHITMAVDAE